MVENTPRDVGQPGVILFMHIPKAAGSTFHTILRRQYSLEEIHTVDGTQVSESLATLRTLESDKRAQLRLVKGHLPFGYHRYFDRPCRYVTMFRRPVPRIISTYYYIRRTPHHPLHEAVESEGLSLREFVESDLTVQLENAQSRQVAGMLGDGADRLITVSDEQLLGQAIENLETHFLAFGLQESFNESVLHICEEAGWRPYLYIRANAASGRPSRDEVPHDAIRAIEERNQVDLEFYSYVERRFSEILQEKGPGFQARLGSYEQRLRILNSLLRPVRPVLTLAEGIIQRSDTLKRLLMG